MKQPPIQTAQIVDILRKCRKAVIINNPILLQEYKQDAREMLEQYLLHCTDQLNEMKERGKVNHDI